MTLDLADPTVQPYCTAIVSGSPKHCFSYVCFHHLKFPPSILME